MLKRIDIPLAFAIVAVAVVVLAIFLTASSPIVPEMIQKTAQSQSQLSAQEREQDIAAETVAYYTKMLAWFTAALAIASLAQGFFLIRADRTARISAEAATKASNAAIAVEMPMVFLEEIELFSPEPAVIISNDRYSRVTETAPPTGSHLLCSFRNSGRTPARAERFCVVHLVADKLPPEPEYFLVTQLPTGTVIEANGGTLRDKDGIGRIIYFQDAQREAIAAGNAYLWVYGMIQFRDFLGKAHTTRFCARWWGIDSDVTSDAKPGFFEDGPESYRTNT